MKSLSGVGGGSPTGVRGSTLGRRKRGSSDPERASRGFITSELICDQADGYLIGLRRVVSRRTESNTDPDKNRVGVFLGL